MAGTAQADGIGLPVMTIHPAASTSYPKELVNGDFRTGVVAAGNFGRDADTIGAVAGAVLGARYGAGSIPQHWISKTQFPSGTCLSFTKGIDILDYADKIAALMK